MEGRQTVEQRSQEISARLLLMLNRPMNPETLVFDVSQLNNVKIVERGMRDLLNLWCC